jgi:hypothetical protein
MGYRYFSFLSKALDAVVQLCKQLAMAAVAGLAFIILLVIGRGPPHGHTA